MKLVTSNQLLDINDVFFQIVGLQLQAVIYAVASHDTSDC
jgi:hypothetical protein